ncbi:MAG: hypothetical protein HY819_13820 [Acidobacteria bacterium]|nr:hypothetical protein [Acidobacteriota bacterium]
MSDKQKKKYTWEQAKELYQLSDEATEMAKELDLDATQLVKSLERSKQPPKMSVEDWIRDLYSSPIVNTKQKSEQKPKQEPKQESKQESKQEPKQEPKQGSKQKPKPIIETSSKIINFSSVNKEDKPTKTVKANRTTKSGQAEKKLLEIRKVVLNIEDDAEELPLKLWDLVEWMVENKKESLIREMMIEDEEISDAGIFALDFVLKDIGYRYPLSLPVKGKKGKFHLEEFELIPFAILMLVPVEDEKLNRVPTKLLKTIEKLTKDKILRKAFLLDERPAIALDPHLYHVDHNEWLEESSVMKYLDGYSAFFSNLSPNIEPLTKDYKEPSLVSRENMVQGTPQFCLVMRALCGAILAHDDESLDVEEQLFEHSESIDSETKLEVRQKAWEKVEEIIVKEFEEHGISLPHGMFVNPSAVELWDIPHVSISLSRILPLQLELHNAIAQLTAEIEDGEIFTPTLYVSQHGEDNQIAEIRLAAYSDPNHPAFFRYVWVINPEFDDPDDVASTVIAIANELEAEVVALEGLRPKEYCSDCGEALFYGPGENQETIIHSHEEYIN